MYNNKISMVSVEYILNNVRTSCDFGNIREHGEAGMSNDECRTEFWKTTIETKAMDSGFGHLINSILENGWEEDSAVGWDEYNGEITEGHHRLVAAILLGMDEVPVSSWGKGRGTICAHAHHDMMPVMVEV